MTVEQKKSHSKVFWGLIGCGVLGLVVVPIIGILAAIAIPAFLRYLKMAKSAEAQSVTRQLATEIQSQYMEDCKFPADFPPSIDPIPAGGGKFVPNVSTWPAELQTKMNPKMYFSYQGGLLDETTYQVVAMADFDTSDNLAHTYTLELIAGPDCTVEVRPGFVANEFQ